MAENQVKTEVLQKNSQEPGTVRLVATLTLAGMIAGLALVGTYIFTLPYIEANRQKELKEAIFKVLPRCRTYKALQIEGKKLVEVPLKKKSKKPRIFAGFDKDGTLIGFAIPAAEPGFQDLIKAIFGYRGDKKMIIGFQVLESLETPGLGDKIKKDPLFLKNFRALSVEPEIIPVKKGEKNKPNEVETITGATISSKAVVRLLNKGISLWKPYIEDYIKRIGSNGRPN